MFLRHLQYRHKLILLNNFKQISIKRHCSINIKNSNLKLKDIYYYWIIGSGISGSFYAVYETNITVDDSFDGIFVKSLVLFYCGICGAYVGLLCGIFTPIILFTYSINFIKKLNNKTIK